MPWGGGGGREGQREGLLMAPVDGRSCQVQRRGFRGNPSLLASSPWPGIAARPLAFLSPHPVDAGRA